MGTGTVPSACVVASRFLVLANVQLRIFRMKREMVGRSETEVGAAFSTAAVHLGTSLEMVMVVEGVSVNMPMLAVSEVGRGERKTGACASFDVDVVGQDTNTMLGVSSNSGAVTRVRLPFGMGMGTGMVLVTSAGKGTGMNVLGVAGGLRVACPGGRT